MAKTKQFGYHSPKYCIFVCVQLNNDRYASDMLNKDVTKKFLFYCCYTELSVVPNPIFDTNKNTL